MKVRKLGFLDSFFIVITDVLLINAGYILAFIIRFGYLPTQNYNDYVKMIPWIIVLTFFLFKIYGLYNLYRKNLADVAFSSAISIVMIMAFTMALTFFIEALPFLEVYF